MVPWDLRAAQIGLNERRMSDEDTSLESRSVSSLGLFVAIVFPLDKKSICGLELLDQLPPE